MTFVRGSSIVVYNDIPSHYIPNLDKNSEDYPKINTRGVVTKTMWGGWGKVRFDNTNKLITVRNGSHFRKNTPEVDMEEQDSEGDWETNLDDNYQDDNEVVLEDNSEIFDEKDRKIKELENKLEYFQNSLKEIKRRINMLVLDY